MKWPTVTLGDHADLLTGFPFKSRDFTTDPAGVRLLRGANVAQAQLDWDNVRRLPTSMSESYAAYFLAPGDVVLAMDRPWIEAGLKYAWITVADLPTLLVQRVSRIRGTTGLLTDYVRFLVGSPGFTDYIAPIVTGVTVPHISPSQIKGFRFGLPPLVTQRKIAAILAAYDDLIENNNRRIRILEEMAQRIYREWFVEFKYPGREDVPLVELDFGSIPLGWRWSPASEALEINPKIRVDDDETRPFVPMTSLSEQGMHISPIDTRSGRSGSRFENGDTLFARITPCLENGKTAYVQCLRDGEVASGSTEFIVLRSRLLCPELAYLLARDERLRSHAIKSMAGASGRQRVRVECFDSFPVAVPPPALVDLYVDLARPMFRLSYELFTANAGLRGSRDLLLPRLVSGEIDVTDLDVAMPDLAA